MGVRRRVGELGDPEVDELEDFVAVVVSSDEDVLRLDVAVNNAVEMGMLETAEDLQDQLHRARSSHRLAQHARELGALKQLHDHVHHPVVGRSGVGHLHAVGMLEPRCRPGLTLEARGHLGVRAEVGMQDLDREVAMQTLVMRAENRSHATDPNKGLDSIASGHGLADQRPEVLVQCLERVAHRLERAQDSSTPAQTDGALTCIPSSDRDLGRAQRARNRSAYRLCSHRILLWIRIVDLSSRRLDERGPKVALDASKRFSSPMRETELVARLEVRQHLLEFSAGPRTVTHDVGNLGVEQPQLLECDVFADDDGHRVLRLPKELGPLICITPSGQHVA